MRAGDAETTERGLGRGRTETCCESERVSKRVRETDLVRRRDAETAGRRQTETTVPPPGQRGKA